MHKISYNILEFLKISFVFLTFIATVMTLNEFLYVGNIKKTLSLTVQKGLNDNPKKRDKP